jgi:hypothetical protein
MSKPIFKPGQLTLGNPGSAAETVALRTLGHRVAQAVPGESFAVVGQLHSPSSGPDPLVRNLLADPSRRSAVAEPGAGESRARGTH